jgi:hypothetical protein
MKHLPKAYPALAVLVLTGLAAVWVTHRHRADSAGGPRATDGPPDLAAANEPVLRRVAIKQEAAAALVRGEIDLATAVARFREVNANNPAAYTLLREQYPRAGDDELEFRQVLHFVRWAGRPLSDVVPARLPRLEAEFFARFPTADPFPDWFRTHRPSAGAAAPILGTERVTTDRRPGGYE